MIQALVSYGPDEIRSADTAYISWDELDRLESLDVSDEMLQIHITLIDHLRDKFALMI